MASKILHKNSHQRETISLRPFTFRKRLIVSSTSYIAKPIFAKKINTHAYAIHEKNVAFFPHKLRLLTIENHIPKGNYISMSIDINALRRGSTTFIRTHTKEKPYCRVSFAKRLCKKSRKNSYQRETIYQCEHCQTCFPWKDSLKDHIRTRMSQLIRHVIRYIRAMHIF